LKWFPPPQKKGNFDRNNSYLGREQKRP
jgi:hypothetical protein